MNLYLDIETLPPQRTADDQAALVADVAAKQQAAVDIEAAGDDEMVRRGLAKVGNIKDPVKIAEKCSAVRADLASDYRRQADQVVAQTDESWRRLALDVNRCVVLAIAYAVDDRPPTCLYNLHGTREGEERIIRDFGAAVQRVHAEANGDLDWWGHNILNFDLPIIHHRAVYSRDRGFLALVPWGRYPENVYDTMREWTGPDYRATVSLDSLCDLIGVEPRKVDDGLDGSGVLAAWQAGQHEKIPSYAANDVLRLREIAWRLRPGTKPTKPITF